MYISKLNIKNFRCFDQIDVEFNEGMNVLIGSNNAGKTTLIKALELIFSRSKSKTLTIDDFNKNIDITIPPEITITATLQSSQNDTKDDKAIVASWLTKLNTPWEATLTYRFFLPEQEHNTYQEIYANLTTQKERWNLLETFLKRYVSRIYGGNIQNRLRAEGEYLNKMHCETLDALRDVESKMFTGRNTLLRQLLQHFKDNSFEEEQNGTANGEEESEEDLFTYHSEKLVSNLISKINQEEVLDFAEKTGASIGGTPALKGSLNESDVFSALRLIIKDHTDIEIPIINNGMGYNNLIYISLILSKFKMITSKDYGENAKTFPILLIEEPEAHLHPALQYNFLKFLNEEIKSQNFSRQIFITTHSTQITSAVGLDPIICLEKDESGIYAKYPGRVFSVDQEDQKSKKYVERFLDATKSAMLFSKSVLLVEGMAELVLLPVLAEKSGYDLDKHHVSLVRVDALTFKHFIKLYGAGIKPEKEQFALQKRVGCIIDSDPRKIERKTKEVDQKRRSWKKCWPFEINSDLDNYEYDSKSGALKNLLTQQENCTNVNIYYQEENGKTFEYDLAWENYLSELIFDESIEILELPELAQSGWEGEKKERAKRASSFLIYADNQKGEVAFNLASKLGDGDTQLNLPVHIKDALAWVCHKNNEGN